MSVAENMLPDDSIPQSDRADSWYVLAARKVSQYESAMKVPSTMSAIEDSTVGRGEHR